MEQEGGSHENVEKVSQKGMEEVKIEKESVIFKSLKE